MAVVPMVAAAQIAPTQQNSVCTFDDGKQISLRYPAVKADKKLPNGQVWTPGQPIYLFSQTELEAGGSTLAPKAYRIYLIPGNDKWTLVINDQVDKGAKYSKDHVVAKVPMDLGKLSGPQQDFEMALGHTGPKQCSVRVYYGSTGAFATLQEK
jgi:hypothetical protein